MDRERKRRRQAAERYPGGGPPSSADRENPPVFHPWGNRMRLSPAETASADGEIFRGPVCLAGRKTGEIRPRREGLSEAVPPDFSRGSPQGTTGGKLSGCPQSGAAPAARHEYGILCEMPGTDGGSSPARQRRNSRSRDRESPLPGGKEAWTELENKA